MLPRAEVMLRRGTTRCAAELQAFPHVSCICDLFKYAANGNFPCNLGIFVAAAFTI